MVNPSYFQGRKVVIATKHQKESVIGPALKKAFGLEYIISECLDTEFWGHFQEKLNDQKAHLKQRDRNATWEWIYVASI
jgi:hypothetical protein